MTKWLLPLSCAACTVVTGIGDYSVSPDTRDAGDEASIECSWQRPSYSVHIFYAGTGTAQLWSVQRPEAKSFAGFVR